MEYSQDMPFEDFANDASLDLNDLELALKQVRRKGEIAEEINILNEIGNLQCKNGDYDSGLGNFFEALQNALGYERKDLESITRFYIAMAYMQNDNYPAAEFELEQALGYFDAAAHPQADLVRQKLAEVRSKS